MKYWEVAEKSAKKASAMHRRRQFEMRRTRLTLIKFTPIHAVWTASRNSTTLFLVLQGTDLNMCVAAVGIRWREVRPGVGEAGEVNLCSPPVFPSKEGRSQMLFGVFSFLDVRKTKEVQWLWWWGYQSPLRLLLERGRELFSPFKREVQCVYLCDVRKPRCSRLSDIWRRNSKRLARYSNFWLRYAEKISFLCWFVWDVRGIQLFTSAI